MRKRFMCLILASLLLLGLLPGAATPAAAVEIMTTSEACIDILKDMEGFLEYPVEDNGQYTVGYGSSCGQNDYPNGITPEEADALLRTYLAGMELQVNGFAQRFNIVLAQNQFDALMLFTYNCGGNWVNSDGTFRQAVIEGKTGNEFIYAITLWSNAAAGPHMGLVKRRLIEADMYLNGSYTNKKPSNFTYVLLDCNGGVAEGKVQGYDANLTAKLMVTPTRSEYRFLGWYTSAEGGAWITELTPANAEQTIYAHWQDASSGEVEATPASYQLTSDELDSLNVYSAPGGEIVSTLSQSAVVSIVGDYVDAAGMKWGRMSSGKWLRLGDPRLGATPEAEEEVGIEVTVTGNVVNVRSGPGTNYKVVSSVSKGDKLIITETRMVGNTLWGKFRAGWLSLQYTSYAGGLTPEQPDSSDPLPDPEEDTPIATGTIIPEMLNIRATPGPNGYLMGCYTRGTKVTIFERAVTSGVPWGRTDKGWINLQYVLLDTQVTDPTTKPTVPGEDPTEKPSTEPTTKPTEPSVPPQTPEVPVQPQEGLMGTVTASALIIRKAPGTGSAMVDTYPQHSRIRILEQKLHKGILWGRTDKGWVCMAYVKLDPNGTDNNAGVKGTVTASALIIRKGPGTTHASVGTYPRGSVVTILEIQANGRMNWGRTDKGWISMQYVNLEANIPVTPPATNPTEPTPTTPPATQPPVTEPVTPPATEPIVPPVSTGIGGTVTASGLNIRSAANTGAAAVGYYTRGTRIVILEQKLVNGMVWGRTDKGWVSMSYVQLDPNNQGNTAVGFNVTITASSLCIRKDPGTNGQVLGTYLKGKTVLILETRKVGNTTWGRTDKGWISMQYVTNAVDAPVAPPVTNDPTIPTEPAPTTPPATEPPVTEPPVTEPPVTEPPVTEPPVTEPPVTEPPVTEPPVTEIPVTFDFTCEEFVTAFNSILAPYDAAAKLVDSGTADSVCYEFAAVSDGGSYGVVMYIATEEGNNKVSGIMMICDATSEKASENLAVFAVYAMMLVDNTITEADLQEMMSEPHTNADGNEYYLMQRASGEYAFILTDTLFHFYAYPYSE